MYYLEKNDTRRFRLSVFFTMENMRIDRKVDNEEEDNRLKKSK